MTAKSDNPRAAALRAQGLELKRCRVAQGLTQTGAAVALEVTVDAWRKWEYGYRGCPEPIRQQVARQWGGDVRQLGLDGRCPCCGRAYE